MLLKRKQNVLSLLPKISLHIKILNNSKIENLFSMYLYL